MTSQLRKTGTKPAAKTTKTTNTSPPDSTLFDWPLSSSSNREGCDPPDGREYFMLRRDRHCHYPVWHSARHSSLESMCGLGVAGFCLRICEALQPGGHSPRQPFEALMEPRFVAKETESRRGMSEKDLEALERMVRHRPFYKLLNAAFREASAKLDGIPKPEGSVLRESEICKFNDVIVGSMMEKTNELLKETNLEVEESKKILQGLANDIRAIYDFVAPALNTQIQTIRSHRMSLVTELRETMTMLSDVRRFFLDKDYELEMKRLERFIAACKDIRELKQDGTFDAVCDSAIRLSLQQPQEPEDTP